MTQLVLNIVEIKIAWVTYFSYVSVFIEQKKTRNIAMKKLIGNVIAFLDISVQWNRSAAFQLLRWFFEVLRGKCHNLILH